MGWLDYLTSDVDRFRTTVHGNAAFIAIVDVLKRSSVKCSVAVFEDRIVLQKLYEYIIHDTKDNEWTGEFSGFTSGGEYNFSSYGMKPLPNRTFQKVMAEEICRAIQPYYSERLTVYPWGIWDHYDHDHFPSSWDTAGISAPIVGGAARAYIVDAVSRPRSAQLKDW